MAPCIGVDGWSDFCVCRGVVVDDVVIHVLSVIGPRGLGVRSVTGPSILAISSRFVEIGQRIIRIIDRLAGRLEFNIRNVAKILIASDFLGYVVIKFRAPLIEHEDHTIVVTLSGCQYRQADINANEYSFGLVDGFVDHWCSKHMRSRPYLYDSSLLQEEPNPRGRHIEY